MKFKEKRENKGPLKEEERNSLWRHFELIRVNARCFNTQETHSVAGWAV